MDSSNDNDKLLEDMKNQKIAEYAPAIAYSALVIVIGITGNIFSIAYYGFKTHRTTTNILITALATTDLIACIVFCDEIIKLCYTYTFKSVIGCKIMVFTNHTMVFTSGFILLLISLDRFQKICRRQSWQMTVKTAKIGIGAVVIFCVIISVRNFVILDVVPVNVTDVNVVRVNVTDVNVTGYACAYSRDNNMKSVVTAFQLIDFACFIILIPTMFVLYSLVAREIWIQRKKKESHMQLEITKSSASTPNESSTEISAIETTSSDLSGVNTKTTNSSGHDVKMDIIKTISDKLTGKHTYEVTKNTDKIKLHPSKPTPKGKVDKPSENHHSRKTHERKIAIMMIATTAGSVLSFVPYLIVDIAVIRNSDTPEQEFSVGMQFALRSFMLNNAINPYIMGIFNTQFKRFVRDILCACRR